MHHLDKEWTGLGGTAEVRAWKRGEEEETTPKFGTSAFGIVNYNTV